MLNEVQPDLKAGDVVVVSLEYEEFKDFPPSPKYTFDAIEARWQNAQFVPPSYIAPLLDRGLIIIGGVLRRSLSFTPPKARQPYYARSGFNAFGDMAAHHHARYDDVQMTDEQRETRFVLKPEGVQQMVKALNAFSQAEIARQAKVVYVYPPMLSQVLAANRPEIQKLETTLKQSLTFPILNQPEETAYSEQELFDTRYHLNQTGVKRRTKHLVKKLATYLKR